MKSAIKWQKIAFDLVSNKKLSCNFSKIKCHKLLECYGIQQIYEHIYTCCTNHSHSQHILALWINDIVIIKIIDEIRYAVPFRPDDVCIRCHGQRIQTSSASPSPPLYSQGVGLDPYLSIKVVLNCPHVPTAAWRTRVWPLSLIAIAFAPRCRQRLHYPNIMYNLEIGLINIDILSFALHSCMHSLRNFS